MATSTKSEAACTSSASRTCDRATIATIAGPLLRLLQRCAEGDGAGGFQIVEGHHVGALDHADGLHGALAEHGVRHKLTNGELRGGAALSQVVYGETEASALLDALGIREIGRDELMLKPEILDIERERRGESPLTRLK